MKQIIEMLEMGLESQRGEVDSNAHWLESWPKRVKDLEDKALRFESWPQKVRALEDKALRFEAAIERAKEIQRQVDYIYEGSEANVQASLLNIAGCVANKCNTTAPTEYTTQAGDSIMGIATRELGNERRWNEVFLLNSDRFPDMTQHEYYPVGTVLFLPPKVSSGY